jgi:hypothetical protein
MEIRFLRRYTDLTALLYLLNTKRITLLDSSSWDDKNDSRYKDSILLDPFQEFAGVVCNSLLTH